jgi:hypothetical protein
MGCSKPDNIPCPQAGSPSPLCIACGYYYIHIDDGCTASISWNIPKVAKFIDQFTTDELLAEIKRRMGT